MGDDSLINDDVWGVWLLTSIGEGQVYYPDMVDFITENQNDDGGWSWNVGSESDADSTASTVSALIASGLSRSSGIITDALDYLKTQQQNNGGFVSEGTTNSGVDSWVIRAINDAGQDPTGEGWRKGENNPVGHLLGLQDSDGSFKYTASQSSRTEWMTAYAIMALLGSEWPVDSSSPIISNISPSSGSSISSTSPEISADYMDTISGIDETTARIWLDSENVTEDADITDQEIIYDAEDLSTGTHTVKVSVSDMLGIHQTST
jgi:hypothetical protein